MERVLDKQASYGKEARLSDAILRFTHAAPDSPDILRVLTEEARHLTEAEWALFFAVKAGPPRSLVSAPAAIAGTPPHGSDRVMDDFFQARQGPPAPAISQPISATPIHDWSVHPLSSHNVLYGHLILGGAHGNHFDLSDDRRISALSALMAFATLALDRAALAATELTARWNLRRALAIRDNFLSIASHELRNPLNSLHLRLDILKRETGLMAAAEGQAERLVAHVAKAAVQVGRMAALLDRLLDVSRIASGRIGLEPRQYDIALQIARVAEGFTDQSIPGQIQMSLSGPVIGSWDELRVDQVITNLLSNAIKYGDGKPIELTLRIDKDWVEIIIADHGIGIAGEDQIRIFERFEQVETDRLRSGYGLGLWICRQIVVASGGTIGVESKLGEGSAFTVRLPRRLEASPLSGARE
jgi:signal transduction histidine kinase